MATRKKISPLAGDIIVVHNELEALNKADQNKLKLTDLIVLNSIDIDTCFQPSEPNATRWDYYIGLKGKAELYVEIHKVNEAELNKLLRKAEWLRGKIQELGWPSTEGRPLFVAPTAGIELGAVYGELNRRLALRKILIVMKGTRIADLL